MQWTAMIRDLVSLADESPTPVCWPCIKGPDDSTAAPNDQRPRDVIEFSPRVVRWIGVQNQPARGATVRRNFGILNAGLILSMGYKRFMTVVQNYMDVAILIGIDAKDRAGRM